MLRAAFQAITDPILPRQHHSALAIVHSDFPDGQRRFLFTIPSHVEALRNRNGLRLLGGVGEKGETPVQTLFRELREELIGHDTMEKHARGEMVEITELQDRALGLLSRKQAEMEKRLATGELWSRHYHYNPDRFHPQQKNWKRSANHIYELPLTPEEFKLLEQVGIETTKRDHKELSGVKIMTEREIKSAFSRGDNFMGYKGENRSLSLFLNSPQGKAPEPNAP